MWESVLAEILRLLPQLLVTFVGVFLAFMLDRLIDWRRRSRDKKDLLRDLRSELEEIRDKLTGEGHLHFPDIWDSAISSGQIRLLSSEQVTTLASVYRDVKGMEYEAKRVRDMAERYRMASATGRASNKLQYQWSGLSAIQRDREKKLRKKIDEILNKEWWNTKSLQALKLISDENQV